MRDMAWGMYVHVPFCDARCGYCDFNTYAGIGRLAPAYFSALLREIELFKGERRAGEAAGRCGPGANVPKARDPKTSVPQASVTEPEAFDTAFVGGGTPSSVAHELVCEALGALGATQAERAHALWECTVEANPGTLTAEMLRAWRKSGANRLSVGLQSTHGRHLAMLGRRHSYDDFLDGIHSARRAGFENIGADLIFGLPGQTAAEWEQTLELVLRSGVTHLSCYSLSLEEGTPLALAVAKGDLPAPDECVDREMYHFARRALASVGMPQYELSNFAAPRYECRHNIKYWTGAPYRGFGAGAASFDGARRFVNELAVDGYIKLIGGAASSEGAVAEREDVGADGAEKEYVILRLRLSAGLTTEGYRRRFGAPFEERHAAELERLVGEGLLSHDRAAGRVALTPRGMDMANRVFAAFV